MGALRSDPVGGNAKTAGKHLYGNGRALQIRHAENACRKCRCQN